MPPQLRDDAAECLRGEIFLTSQLLFALGALVAFPPYLGFWGKPDLLTAAIFVLSVCPALCAVYVSRTGRLEAGRLASTATLTLLAGVLAAASGGLASPFLALFAVLPAQVALARGPLWQAAGIGVPLAGLGALGALVATGLVAAGPAPLLALSVAGGATLIAGVLAVNAGRFVAAHVEQAAARGQEERDLLDNAPDLVIRLRRTGNVLSANRAAEGVLGTSPEDLAGEGFVRRVHVQDRPAYMQALDRAWVSGHGSVGLRVRAADGDYAQVELRVRRIGDRAAGGDLVGFISSARERVETETALRHALETAERASIGKGRLLANMSHELRTPLNAILGFSEILSSDMSGRLAQEKHREYAKLIHESGSHLLDVVNAILDMSKLETGRFQVFPEPFSLDETIRTCCQLMEPQAQEAGVTLETDGLGTDDEVTADPRAVKQILLNLVSNAVKFSSRGDRVVAGAYRTETEALALYVADEGRGIAADDIERLGEPFVQLKMGYDHGGGTGLGLSVVRGLAQLHGGTMSIESKLGAGTRVTVVLPQEARQTGEVVGLKTGAADEEREASPLHERLSA